MTFHTHFIGNLTADPEMRYIPSGTAICNFNVAVDDSYTDAQGGRVKRTMFLRVSAWGKQGENCNQYLKKGNKVYVEGVLVGDYQTNAQGALTMNGPKVWNAQDGTPRASFEFKANRVEFLTPKGAGGGVSGGDPSGQQPTSAPPAVDDDIPF